MRLLLVILGLLILSFSVISLFFQWFFAKGDSGGSASLVLKESISLLLVFWGAYLIIAFRKKEEPK